MKGIDVSEHNGIINWEKVKSQIDFAIIRVSWGKNHIDGTYKRNIEECIRLKIPFGVYFYSYALTTEDVEKEVYFMLSKISDYKEEISFPVIIDMEDADGYKAKNGMPDNEKLVKICEVALEIIGTSGYFPMLYANKDWFDNKLNSERLNKYAKWLAWWYDKAVFDKAKYTMWQYTSKGKIDGIGGNVDLSESYINFPESLKYLKMIVKMQQIKMATGFQDSTLEYFNSYKFRDELINKIYERLQKPKVKYDDSLSKWDFIKKEFKIEDRTIRFFEDYYWSDDLREKLLNSIKFGG